MLNLIWLVAVILVVLWVVGMVTSTTMGGLIHGLLVLAIVDQRKTVTSGLIVEVRGLAAGQTQ